MKIFRCATLTFVACLQGCLAGANSKKRENGGMKHKSSGFQLPFLNGPGEALQMVHKKTSPTGSNDEKPAKVQFLYQERKREPIKNYRSQLTIHLGANGKIFDKKDTEAGRGCNVSKSSPPLDASPEPNVPADRFPLNACSERRFITTVNIYQIENFPCKRNASHPSQRVLPRTNPRYRSSSYSMPRENARAAKKETTAQPIYQNLEPFVSFN